MILPILAIAPSDGRGRGVFSTALIPAGTVVEVSPVLVLTERERALVEQTMLYDYIFAWGDEGRQACVALGYLSVYNHSADANCDYEMDYDERLITIRTIKDIAAGEELFINYDENGVWFDSK